MSRSKRLRHIPVQLTLSQFNEFIFEHLPKRKRGAGISNKFASLRELKPSTVSLAGIESIIQPHAIFDDLFRMPVINIFICHLNTNK